MLAFLGSRLRGDPRPYLRSHQPGTPRDANAIDGGRREQPFWNLPRCSDTLHSVRRWLCPDDGPEGLCLYSGHPVVDSGVGLCHGLGAVTIRIVPQSLLQRCELFVAFLLQCEKIPDGCHGNGVPQAWGWLSRCVGVCGGDAKPLGLLGDSPGAAVMKR